jgi:hypothetical protein
MQMTIPAGKTFDRETYLSDIEVGNLRYAKWVIGAINVRAVSDMAIIRYQATLTFDSGNTIQCWHTDSYELRAEHWLAVWSQATLIKTQ